MVNLLGFCKSSESCLVGAEESERQQLQLSEAGLGVDPLGGAKRSSGGSHG